MAIQLQKSSDKQWHESTCEKNPQKEIACSQCKELLPGKHAYEQHLAVMHSARNPKSGHGKTHKGNKK